MTVGALTPMALRMMTAEGSHDHGRDAVDEAEAYRRVKRAHGRVNGVVVFDIARAVHRARRVSWGTAIDIAERKVEQGELQVGDDEQQGEDDG